MGCRAHTTPNPDGVEQPLNTDQQIQPRRGCGRLSHIPTPHFMRGYSHSILAGLDFPESEIDRLVYQMYGLTEEEIKIVEGS
jgi:hypothetical protein